MNGGNSGSIWILDRRENKYGILESWRLAGPAKLVYIGCCSVALLLWSVILIFIFDAPPLDGVKQ